MNQQNKFIRDVIHGEIDVSASLINQLIKSKEMKRLRNIKQLGLAFYLFPCATHTRFAHSLGTYYLAMQVLKAVDHDLSTKDIDALLAAALLHDLGHGPLSHSFETYMDVDHEEMTRKIILDKETDVHKILLANNVKPQSVVDILFHKHKINWLNSVISSQIDVDRMDYLARDAHYTGACYGLIDSQILLRWLELMNGNLCFDTKATSSIENFLLARYHMYLEVYEKPKNCAFQSLISKILNRYKKLFKLDKIDLSKNQIADYYLPWLLDKDWTVAQYQQINDLNFEMFLQQISFVDDPYLKQAFIELNQFNNDDYLVLQPNDQECKDLVKYWKETKENCADIYYHPISIHKKKIYDSEKQPIYISHSIGNKLMELSTYSEIVNHLKRFKQQTDFIVIKKKN